MLDTSAAPQLFSFVSYRRERFGGFLFNPYLQQELSLDPAEFAVVSLCDGSNPLLSMPVELARMLCTDRATAERRLLATLDKLERYYALKWRDAPPSSAAALPRENHECRSAGLADPAGPEATLSAPLSIIWELTHACNLNCLHCLSASGKKASGELTTAEALAFIDELARLKVFTITLSGGEPLVRKDLFELLRRISDHNLCARLTTNGYAVNDETLRRLADLNVFAAQVSVDGLRETHDALRNHRGSFVRAIGALRRFVAAGYHTLMTTTVSDANVEQVPALLDMAVELGVSGFKVGPCVPLGRALENAPRLAVSHARIRWLAQRLRDRQRQLGERVVLLMDGLFPWLLEPPPSEPSGASPQTCGPGCSAGISQVLVAYDGNVYPCPYIRSVSAGNLRRAPLREIWNNAEVFAPLRRFDQTRITGKCRDCPYHLTECSGGCRGMALAAGHDLYAQDPHCWFGTS